MGNSASSSASVRSAEDASFTVDGGYIVPQGLYSNSPVDYDVRIVKKLIAERKISPFYKGLNEEPLEAKRTTDGVEPATKFAEGEKFQASILVEEEDLVTSATTTSAIAIDSNTESTVQKKAGSNQYLSPGGPDVVVTSASAPVPLFSSLPVLPAARHDSDNDSNLSRPESRGASIADTASIHSLQAGRRPLSHSSSFNNLGFQFRHRKRSSQKKKPHHDIYAQIPIEELYRGSIECPICFLYYPRNINYTRCCDQPICTECFVQIKRSESTMDPSECPYCCEQHFGITYSPPPPLQTLKPRRSSHRLNVSDGNIVINSKDDTGRSRRVSIMSKDGVPYSSQSASTSSSSLIFGHFERPSSRGLSPRPSPPASPPVGSPVLEYSGLPGSGNHYLNRPFEQKQRRKSALSVESSLVVTTDMIRPDWKQKQQQLIIQRDLQQRRMSLMEATMLSRGRLGTNGGQSLSGAASAAAVLMETLANVHRPGDHTPTPANPGTRPSAAIGLEYFSALQHVGADIEDLMLLEALRRSLIDVPAEQPAETEASNSEPHADEDAPPLPPREEQRETA